MIKKCEKCGALFDDDGWSYVKYCSVSCAMSAILPFSNDYGAYQKVYSNYKDLSGMRFGMLTVVKRGENDKNRHAMWYCKCDCGKAILVSSSALLNGNQKSCGCSNKRRTSHGESKSRLYHIYSGMKQRCYNPNNNRYEYYGARGIQLCDEWKSNYGAFAEWSKAHGYSDSLSIDRIDVNGDYSPDNCRWIPLEDQSKNRRICTNRS